MNLSMALFRSPVIALMPDITPLALQQPGQRDHQLHGRPGSAARVLRGQAPVRQERRRCLHRRRHRDARRLPAGGALHTRAADRRALRRREERRPLCGSACGAGRDTVGRLQRREEPALHPGAILCWFVGFNAIETFFTSYAKYPPRHEGEHGRTDPRLLLGDLHDHLDRLGLPRQPAGRRQTIRLGLSVVLAVMLSALFLRGMLARSPRRSWWAASGGRWST